MFINPFEKVQSSSETFVHVYLELTRAFQKHHQKVQGKGRMQLKERKGFRLLFFS